MKAEQKIKMEKILFETFVGNASALSKKKNCENFQCIQKSIQGCPEFNKGLFRELSQISAFFLETRIFLMYKSQCFARD